MVPMSTQFDTVKRCPADFVDEGRSTRAHEPRAGHGNVTRGPIRCRAAASGGGSKHARGVAPSAIGSPRPSRGRHQAAAGAGSRIARTLSVMLVLVASA
jgi:hypothetical protein